MLSCWISRIFSTSTLIPHFTTTYNYSLLYHFCTAVPSSLPSFCSTPLRVPESHRNLLSRVPRPFLPPCSLHPNKSERNEDTSVLGFPNLSTARQLPTFRKISVLSFSSSCSLKHWGWRQCSSFETSTNVKQSAKRKFPEDQLTPVWKIPEFHSCK